MGIRNLLNKEVALNNARPAMIFSLAFAGLLYSGFFNSLMSSKKLFKNPQTIVQKVANNVTETGVKREKIFCKKGHCSKGNFYTKFFNLGENACKVRINVPSTKETSLEMFCVRISENFLDYSLDKKDLVLKNAVDGEPCVILRYEFLDGNYFTKGIDGKVDSAFQFSRKAKDGMYGCFTYNDIREKNKGIKVETFSDSSNLLKENFQNKFDDFLKDIAKGL